MEEDEPAGTHTNPVPLHAQAAAAAAAAAGSSSEPTPPSTLTPSAGGPAAIAEAVPTHTSEAARNPDQPISANEQQEVGGLEIRQRPAPAGEAAGGDPLDGSEVGGLQIRQRPTATAAADAGAPSVGAAGRGSSGMGAAKSVKTTPGGLPGVSYAPSQQSSQQPSQQLLTREQIKAGRRPLANGASPAISTAGMSTADDQASRCCHHAPSRALFLLLLLFPFSRCLSCLRMCVFTISFFFLLVLGNVKVVKRKTMTLSVSAEALIF